MASRSLAAVLSACMRDELSASSAVLNHNHPPSETGVGRCGEGEGIGSSVVPSSRWVGPDLYYQFPYEKGSIL